MSKRRAATELTKDNWDDEEEKIEVGTFQVADESILKNRVLKKAKRTLQRDDNGEPKSIFSGFAGFGSGSSNTKQAFSFLSKCNETSTAPSSSGNHPFASTTNSMTTSSSLKLPESNNTKSSNQTLVDPVKVMKLNEAFVKFITNAVQKNPYCVLTPTLKDYEKQISKFIAFSGCKTNVSDSSISSSKESPQVSSTENTIKINKNAEEVKKNISSIQDKPSTFLNPNNNTENKGISFKFSNSCPVTSASSSAEGLEKESNIPVEKKRDESKEEEKSNPSAQTESLDGKNEIPKPPAFNGFKTNSNFKFNPQIFGTPSANKESESSDIKTSPLQKSSEIKLSSIPSFNFGSNTSSFSFNPMEKNDGKPFFNFGAKPPLLASTTDLPKNPTETLQSKEENEEDEDQPPVVSFTPIKENDAIFESKSKLYLFKNGKYEEHGVGQLYLKRVDDKKIQLIMRNDSALGTIMANTLLNDTVNFTKRNPKNVQLICVLDPTKNSKPQTALFKFKDSQTTDLFENELAKLKTST
ncbi:nuclear pore complex protein Nup50 [Adelges cooleyi]|uniref:nuclear pore complex protein Nup50 n=1 Tax=Adelges cooleyi TaxID=133065 RepID=UPI00217FEAE0|nr:nuclear pore complex protein Nup50 [Adelges cooleyi]